MGSPNKLVNNSILLNCLQNCSWLLWKKSSPHIIATSPSTIFSSFAKRAFVGRYGFWQEKSAGLVLAEKQEATRINIYFWLEVILNN